MSSVTCTKTFSIDAAHRLLKHTGKCRNLHGHRYTFVITFSNWAGEGFTDGMIVDFDFLKKTIGAWLDTELDHKTLLWVHDPLAAAISDIQGGGVVLLNSHPTAEYLSSYVLGVAQTLVPTSIAVTEVTCYETPTSYATTKKG